MAYTQYDFFDEYQCMYTHIDVLTLFEELPEEYVVVNAEWFRDLLQLECDVHVTLNKETGEFVINLLDQTKFFEGFKRMWEEGAFML